MNTHIIRLDFRGYIHLLQTRQLEPEIMSADELVFDLVKPVMQGWEYGIDDLVAEELESDGPDVNRLRFAVGESGRPVLPWGSLCTG